MARWIIAGTLAVSVSLGCLTFSKGHDWGDDFAEYLLQAQYAAEGRQHEFIASNRFTIDNSLGTIGPYAYPWGFPLLLAPIYRLGQFDLSAMKCLNIALFSLTLLCLHALFQRRLGKPASCLLIALLAFNPNFLGFMNNLLSDTPFTFFSVLTILLVDRFIICRAYLLNPLLSHGLLGGAIFLATFTRPNGVFLLPLLLLCQLVEVGKRWWDGGGRPAWAQLARPQTAWGILIGSIPYAVFFLLKCLADRHYPDGSANHYGYFFFSWFWFAGNSAYYAGLCSDLFGINVQKQIIFALCIPFFVMGVRNRWRQDYHFLVFCGMNQLLYSVWPGRGNMRYVLPMMPFYLYFIFQGVAACGLAHANPALNRKRIVWICGIALAAVLLLESAFIACCNVRDGGKIDGPFAESSREMFEFLRVHTAKDARMMFFKPRALRLMAERQAFVSNRPEDVDKADYLVIRKYDGPCMQLRMPFPVPVQRVFENANFVVYRLRRSAEDAR